MQARKIITPQQALQRLEAMCSAAEHCTGEMYDYLRRRGIGERDAAVIVKRLIENRYVDDGRFARSYVNDKIYLARWGKRKVTLELQKKRVDREIIAEALGEVEEERYLQVLDAILKSKIKSKPELLDTYEGRTKLYRFALTRGFESDLVSQVLKSLLKSMKEKEE